ncbi:MAG: bifunctional folylpolyglutamate synthase/dihydrofolate synthase, partial [Clostridiales bacterium]|nr:bifunctional folylpolyglutamate synthase/dihydrofolate synthase [Clostridiales bacterium]
MTYKEARVYLEKVSKYGSVLGLDTIRNLLKRLGNPERDLSFIHIAGTNGKGSVLAYISNILSEAGYRTGRYISPTV